MSELYTKRIISHEEAREIAQRLINSHFRREPYARVSIPAKVDYDDDLLIMAYIYQMQDALGQKGGRGMSDDLLQRLRSIEHMDINQWHSAPVRNTVIDARQEIERLRQERDEWKAKWMSLAQASLIAGTMTLEQKADTE